MTFLASVASSGDESGDYSDLSDESNHKMVLVVRWLKLRRIVVFPLSAFTGLRCSGMIWRWGREKLLHNAATLPYQLTNRPGLKDIYDSQKTMSRYSRINYQSILEIQIVRRKNPDMLRVWECSGQQKVKPQTYWVNLICTLHVFHFQQPSFGF